MVLVIIALVRIVHVTGLIAMMLVSVTLVSIVLMLLGMVLVIIALVRVVHVTRLISVVLVTVTLVWIVDAHPVLLPTGGSLFRLGTSTLRWLDNGNVPEPISSYLISRYCKSPLFTMQTIPICMWDPRMAACR